MLFTINFFETIFTKYPCERWDNIYKWREKQNCKYLWQKQWNFCTLRLTTWSINNNYKDAMLYNGNRDRSQKKTTSHSVTIEQENKRWQKE